MRDLVDLWQPLIDSLKALQTAYDFEDERRWGIRGCSGVAMGDTGAGGEMKGEEAAGKGGGDREFAEEGSEMEGSSSPSTWHEGESEREREPKSGVIGLAKLKAGATEKDA